MRGGDDFVHSLCFTPFGLHSPLVGAGRSLYIYKDTHFIAVESLTYTHTLSLPVRLAGQTIYIHSTMYTSQICINLDER